MCGFIAQLVEQRTGNVEVTGSNPVEALIILHSHLQPQFKNELFHILHISVRTVGQTLLLYICSLVVFL